MSIPFLDLLKTWGSDLETFTPPSDAKIAGGWEGTPAPPYQFFDWWMNRIDNVVRYLKERGIPDWNHEIAYTTDDVVQSNGYIYQCIADNTNHAPPNATYWRGTTAAPTGISATGSPGTPTVGGANLAVSGTIKTLTFRLSVPISGGAGDASVTLSGQAAVTIATAGAAIMKGPAGTAVACDCTYGSSSINVAVTGGGIGSSIDVAVTVTGT